ncbi:DNA polymerase III, subunit gamma and tau [Neorickettsia helminthoeca str. Oregon]|uniref:DNA polymerase III subunit gamma/tau n=1 Tax=Neorickettsia helminthoeca str. Oregon TaxID=1286528 RepID=X5GWH7_9RICK|nr:DNA polymerase III subunit gamma/tau [Neorickettsia helminthoeca]AHX11407.1 DNA polymerase III, subunit gamma and tau [Neorickettsia helminthoeca str. Oregon]
MSALTFHSNNDFSGRTLRMAYIGLANKYRPRSLNEIVGQDFLVKTLSASIALEKVASALLFSGSYGTGKTTAARAMALSINCSDLESSQPCMQCTSCSAVLRNSHPDILEIDAASNTSVEDVRVIIDSVSYRPILSRYKIYIIDEVHMLSQSAFNALLKILEEPPEHIKFFLATTELQKIPSTIISRCQHFRLSRLSKEIISARIKKIAELEKINITEDAIDFISEKSEGSLRDGISILEQSALQQDEEIITLQLLRSKMGLVDITEMTSLLESITSGDCRAAIDTFNTFYQKGYDPLTILEDLIKLINRRIHTSLNSKDETQISFLSRLAKCVLSSMEEIKAFNNNHDVIELSIVRMSYLADLPSPTEIAEIFSRKSAPQSIQEKHDSSELTDYVLKEFKGSKLLD